MESDGPYHSASPSGAYTSAHTGGVGLAAALVQFVSAVSAEVTALPAAASRTSAFNFFLAVTIYSGLTLLAYLFLTRLPLYHLVLQPSKVASQSYRDKSSGPSIRVVERKIRKVRSMFLSPVRKTMSLTISNFDSPAWTVNVLDFLRHLHRFPFDYGFYSFRSQRRGR